MSGDGFALPLIELSGTARAQGRMHGELCAPEIQTNLELYLDRIGQLTGRSTGATRELARSHVPSLERDYPTYLEIVRGVAEGSGRDEIDVVLLNLRYELAAPTADGCTAFAVAPSRTADGHTYLGQNWDWIPGVRGVLTHTREADGSAVLGFTEAGIVGTKIGLNTHGVGLVINGLSSRADHADPPTCPFHARCHDALRHPDIDSARRSLTRGPRTRSASFVIGAPTDRVLGLETSPVGCANLAPVGGVIVHTNHFTRSRDLGVSEPDHTPFPDSPARLARGRQLLAGDAPVTRERLEALLRDVEGSPGAICRRADIDAPACEQHETIVSVIMDLTDRVMYVANGRPRGREYRRYRAD